MRRSIRNAVLAAGVGLVTFWAASGQAQDISFRKIVDTNTPIPGGTGNFPSLGVVPFLDAGTVVFSGPFSLGIYSDIGGTLNVVVDTNTPAPGGTGRKRPPTRPCPSFP